jgi:surfactin synthase thioesterase subunit
MFGHTQNKRRCYKHWKGYCLSAIGKTGKTLEQMLKTTTYTFRNNTQAGNHLFPLTNIEELHRRLKCYQAMKQMLVETKF